MLHKECSLGNMSVSLANKLRKWIEFHACCTRKFAWVNHSIHRFFSIPFGWHFNPFWLGAVPVPSPLDVIYMTLSIHYIMLLQLLISNSNPSSVESNLFSPIFLSFHNSIKMFERQSQSICYHVKHSVKII